MSTVFEVGVSILDREESGGVSVGYRCPVWESLLDCYHLYIPLLRSGWRSSSVFTELER
jgi:hypothetical protein